MTLEEARKHYDYFTSKTSELTGQLAFAGIAVVWLFKPDKGSLDFGLTAALWLFVFCLIFHYLHYLIAGKRWGEFIEKQEKKHGGSDKDQKIDDAPDSLNAPHTFFYWAKILALCLGYPILVWQISAKLFP